MPFSDLTQLNSSDTFQTVFTRNNEMISRLNDLDIGSLKTDGSILLSVIGITGGITLGVNFEKITGISGTVNLLVSGSVPSGLTLNSPIGISGSGLGLSTNLTVSSARNFIGFISGISGNQNYTITTAGKIQNSSLNDNTLYYLNTTGGITSNRPTANNSVIKPVLLNINSTLGGIVLQQNETLISETAVSYIKSSSRTVAEIPTNSTLSSGNVVFYNLTGTTWARSKSDAANTSEVFGIVESIGGSTATIVTHGSINVPNSVLNIVGAGGAGENDIWFLSAATAGQLQNQAPTQAGSIVKPVYYAYPHEISGVTFSGYLVNYIGYAVGASVAAQGSVAESTPSSTTGIAIGEMKQVAFHGNRLGMKDWLRFLKTLIDGSTLAIDTETTKDSWRLSIPYDIGITNNPNSFFSASTPRFDGSTFGLMDYIDKNCVELSGALLLVEEPEQMRTFNGVEKNTASPFTLPENINKLFTTTNDFSSLNGITYDDLRIPLNRFIDVGVKSILKIKTNSLWNQPNPETDKNDRWSQLKRLWFSQTDNNGNRVKLINWANASLLLNDRAFMPPNDVAKEDRRVFGEFGNGDVTDTGHGIDFNYLKEILEKDSTQYNAFKRQLLTSFYLPGFVLDLDFITSNSATAPCRTDQCRTDNFPAHLKRAAEDGQSFSPIDGVVEKGYMPIYSNWMTKYASSSLGAEGEEITHPGDTENWQEIGFYLTSSNLDNEPPRFLFIYSPTWAIKTGFWNIEEIDLLSFFANLSNIPGKYSSPIEIPYIMNWEWIPGKWNNTTNNWDRYINSETTWDSNTTPFTSKPVPKVLDRGGNLFGNFPVNRSRLRLTENGLLQSVVGIHLPDYSSPYSPAGTDVAGFSNACSIPKTVMRVI